VEKQYISHTVCVCVCVSNLSYPACKTHEPYYIVTCGLSSSIIFFHIISYQGDDKSLARPTSFSVVFSVQGTGGSPTGPDTENRVGDQDIGSPGRPVSSGLQVLGEPFPSWSG
jgi:hypothetical protein